MNVIRFCLFVDTGALVLIGMGGLFFHFNSKIKEQIALRVSVYVVVILVDDSRVEIATRSQDFMDLSGREFTGPMLKSLAPGLRSSGYFEPYYLV